MSKYFNYGLEENNLARKMNDGEYRYLTLFYGIIKRKGCIM